MSLERLLLACQAVLVSPSLLKTGLSISTGQRPAAGSMGVGSFQKSQWNISIHVHLESVFLTAYLMSFPLSRFSDMT